MKEVKSILDFDGGSIVDKVQHELKKVLENILDVDTDTKTRTITLKLSLTPDDKRKHITATATASTALRPSHPIKTAMTIMHNKEELVATELTGVADGQVDMFTGEAREAKIFKFERKAQ